MYEEDTWKVEIEREDKSEMKIFCQNILEKKNKRKEYWKVRKFPLTCLKSNPFFGLGRPIRWRSGGEKTKKKVKRKNKRKRENQGKSYKTIKNEREEGN